VAPGHEKVENPCKIVLYMITNVSSMLLPYPEAGGNIFLQNIDSHLQGFMVSQPGRPQPVVHKKLLFSEHSA
jgi:hypothetical protein